MLSRFPHDILLAICDCMELHFPTITTVPRFERHLDTGFYEWCYSGAELFPLSKTCRLLRELCLPIIFRVCVLNDRTENRVVPQSVSVFTRRLYIHRALMDPSRFRDFLRTMPSVSEAYVTDSPHLLPTLLQTETVNILALHSVPMSASLTLFTTVSGSLRTLRLLPRNRLSSPGTALETKSQQIPAETEWLHSLLPLVRPTLEELFLPAESAKLSLLCAAPWPMLRELVLIGVLTMLDASLIGLLAMLPRLQAVTILVIYRRDIPRLLVWPPHTRYVVDLSGIRRLSLSIASDDDDLFAHLSPALEEVSLRDHPRLFSQSRLHNPKSPLFHYRIHTLTCSAALAIFRRLELAFLRRLELVVIGDQRALELLSHLSSACPSLLSFELHIYRAISDNHALWHDPPSIPLTTLATALSAFKGLTVLRLNIEYPLSQVSLSGHSSTSDSARFSEGVARSVALHMPQLRSIGVLGVIDQNIVGWRMWALSEKDGALVLTMDCEARVR